MSGGRHDARGAGRGARRLGHVHARGAGCVVAMLATLSVTQAALAESIDFSAQQMTAEEELLELTGDVRLSYDRFRLRAERLRLQRGHAGLRLEGPARLRACPCEEPPLELEFTSAELSPTGALTLYGPRLVSGDVPLFYWPQLSLVAPDSVGVLPPRVDYRGPDGLFLGLGVEVPLSRSAPSQGALAGLSSAAGGTQARLGVGGYTRFEQPADGARVELDVSGPQGRSAIAWETLEGGMLDIDAYGAYAPAGGGARATGLEAPGALAWRVDALRGARGLRAPGSLVRVAMPEDRARFTVSHFAGPLQGYAQIRAESSRGSAGTQDAQAGAAVGASASQRLLPGLTLRLSGDVLGLSGEHLARDTATAQAALGVWVPRAELEVAAPLGPLSLRSALSAAGQLASVNDAQPRDASAAPGSRAEGAVRLSAALPLARRFGQARHVVTPELGGALLLGEQPRAQAEVALLQRLGGEQARYAVELDLALGAAKRLSPRVEAAQNSVNLGASPAFNYIRGELIAGSRWIAGRLWGIARRAGASPAGVEDATGRPAAAGDGPEWAVISWLRVGREAAAQLQLTLAQQSVDAWDEPRPAQAAGWGGTSDTQLQPDAWRAPLNLAGASSVSQLIVPLDSRFALQLASAWDVSALAARDRSAGLLFGALGAGYRHACGCLAVRAELSHRLGRHSALAQAELGSISELFDASIQLQLFE